jgi:hypothetical protein
MSVEGLGKCFFNYYFVDYFIVKTKKEVGTGGQGTVFAVENPDTHEDYAIKFR